MVRKLLVTVVCGAVLMSASMALAADVLITKRGKKFHATTCALVQNRETSVLDEKQAQARGLQPCGKCLNGDDAGKVAKKEKKEKRDNKE